MLFLIVSGTEPVYQMDSGSSRADDVQHLNEFVAHSSLDLVEHVTWTTSTTSLRAIDRFQDKFVSAFVTPGNIKLLLVHDGRNEDSIRQFFLDIHELYVKYLLSPFSDYNAPILSLAFDKRVRAIAKRI